MAAYTTKQLFLPPGADWTHEIRRYRDQLMKGQPLLMWHGDGIAGFFVADTQRNLLSDRWVAVLLRAAADEIDRLESEEVGK